MSNLIYPTLPGLKFPVKKRPIFNTIIQTAASLREVRSGLASYPVFQWDLQYDFLRDTEAYPEIKTLMGFFMRHYGALDSFKFNDVTDNFVTEQVVGISNGVQTEYQMIRSYGGFIQPIYDIKMTLPTPLIYLDDVLQESGYTIGENTGLLTFDNAPSDETVITATFQYYWRARFKEDSTDFENFMVNLFENKGVTLLGCKP